MRRVPGGTFPQLDHQLVGPVVERTGGVGRTCNGCGATASRSTPGFGTPTNVRLRWASLSLVDGSAQPGSSARRCRSRR